MRFEIANPSRHYWVENIVCGKCRYKLQVWSGNTGEMKARKRARKGNKKKMRAAARQMADDGTA